MHQVILRYWLSFRAVFRETRLNLAICYIAQQQVAENTVNRHKVSNMRCLLRTSDSSATLSKALTFQIWIYCLDNRPR